jgi:NAD(P)-dependent dehydrogenase (short-subunit alcohol dehydrogenase family)
MRYNPFSLEGKTILVTGASSGIGKAIAIECSKMAASLIITGRNKERLQETYDSLVGENHKQIIADISDSEQLISLINEITELSGLVNCAGYTKPIPFQFINETDLSEIMHVNFLAPVLLTQKLIKNKKISKGGSIVFISSISGTYVSSVSGSMYSASKGAVNGISKAMAIELAAKLIRVNNICPGMIDTNIFSSGEITKEQLELDKQKYPLKRYGKPEEVAYAAIYLLSDAAKWVTGSNILIDGGYTLL